MSILCQEPKGIGSHTSKDRLAFSVGFLHGLFPSIYLIVLFTFVINQQASIGIRKTQTIFCKYIYQAQEIYQYYGLFPLGIFTGYYSY